MRLKLSAGVSGVVTLAKGVLFFLKRSWDFSLKRRKEPLRRVPKSPGSGNGRPAEKQEDRDSELHERIWLPA